VEREKPVHIFVMGADVWRDEEDWPLPDTHYRRYYLHSHGHANSAAGDGLLLLEAPGKKEEEDVYCYDPRHPVPTLGGAHLMPFSAEVSAMLNPQLTYVLNAGPLDQRKLEERDDILCYTSQPLERPVEVIGPIELVLAAASSALDTDFTGKLVDVYPDGRAEILTDNILRARYRESFTEPTLMEPGHIYELHVHLGVTANVFKAGHRIRLEVSSSNFPRFERNTNTGGDIITEREEDLQQAINRVYHTQAHPSYLILPIIERE
jgi:putative CocE/NonD family hydrolase